MADYDSESSGGDDVATNVLLGYASKEPTSDAISQLGGHPTWLDDKSAPDGALAKCKVCNGRMNLLLQLHADLVDRFPGHERRLYVWACKRKACRRKAGSVRGFRAVRTDGSKARAAPPAKQPTTGAPTSSENAKPAVNLGETLFGVKSPSLAHANPFATSTPGSGVANPFASTPSPAPKPVEDPTTVEPLAAIFAQKARISSPTPAHSTPTPLGPQEPWPAQSAFPEPYPTYHLDADFEYLEASSADIPSTTRLDSGESSTADDNKVAFESSMDKTFQRFADRLAQNPEQALRYEFDGAPVLYSKTDAVGKLLAPAQEAGNAKVQTASRGTGGSKVPTCANCGAGRVFELQLTPHLITALEVDEVGLDGMDWGTILLGVCGADCQAKGKREGEVGYVEEWTGVQWEELADKRRS
ncbi:hypothetical protein LTR08_008338 [Meristemomyces frigidus]|nr:hypothetical protein LTR08_008338 [Meristemomyces frigidus]